MKCSLFLNYYIIFINNYYNLYVRYMDDEHTFQNNMNGMNMQ
jgi:hypothetical protein